ncbi:hypothetical protein CISIN_1g0375831mg, partial [Citrus sinensis]
YEACDYTHVEGKALKLEKSVAGISTGLCTVIEIIVVAFIQLLFLI